MVNCFGSERKHCSIFDKDVIKGDYTFTIICLFLSRIIDEKCSIFTELLLEVISCMRMIPEYTSVWECNNLFIDITYLDRVLYSTLISWYTVVEIIESYTVWMNGSSKFVDCITNFKLYRCTFWSTESRSRYTPIIREHN